ncbi:unnamed protein product [Plasmodium vivax]|uniref:(malaria parasite P. vivax) hypothetical protein n=1 Tax=Plasmodium vivax TaxID=5855 RepID=A0A8S4H805_PLAVI|nr:unnamed protein product [Plasmodium vivax]
MANPAVAQLSVEQLERSAITLNLHRMHEEFFVKKGNISENGNYCNVFDIKGKENKEAKELCNKLVQFLKEISVKKEREESNNLCSYLPYWLYDEIWGIHSDRKKNIEHIPFVKNLIDAVNNARSKIPNNKCSTLPYYSHINLDEWKKRKISYIYFKKYNEIEGMINSTKKDNCNNHYKYLNNIASLYKLYNQSNCTGIGSWLGSSDYFICGSNYDPSKLLPKVAACKDQVPRRSTGGGGGFSISSLFGGSSLSRGSSEGKAATREQALGSVPKAASQARVKGAGSDVSTQGAKLTVVAPSRNVESAPTVRQLITEKLTVPFGDQKTQVHMENMSISNSEHGTPSEGSDDSYNFLQSAQKILKSEYFPHSVVGASIIGVVILLFYYFRTTPIRSPTNKREKKERKPEDNYYDTHEEELTRYGSQQSFAETQMSDAYLSYQPKGYYNS